MPRTPSHALADTQGGQEKPNAMIYIKVTCLILIFYFIIID